MFLSATEAAIAATQSLQSQIELEIDSELNVLRSERSLDANEWRFLDALLPTMSGNVLVSVAMNRYGGTLLAQSEDSIEME